VKIILLYFALGAITCALTVGACYSVGRLFSSKEDREQFHTSDHVVWGLLVLVLLTLGLGVVLGIGKGVASVFLQ
jgi:hypothetical protein